MAVEISETVRKKISASFPDDFQAVAGILTHECSDNLPFCQGLEYRGLIERVRLAVLQLSQGDVDRFLRLVVSAQQDWRNVLVAAEG